MWKLVYHVEPVGSKKKKKKKASEQAKYFLQSSQSIYMLVE